MFILCLYFNPRILYYYSKLYVICIYLKASSDSGTWDELVALKSDLRLEIDNLNIQHVNGYNVKLQLNT